MFMALYPWQWATPSVGKRTQRGNVRGVFASSSQPIDLALVETQRPAQGTVIDTVQFRLRPSGQLGFGPSDCDAEHVCYLCGLVFAIEPLSEHIDGRSVQAGYEISILSAGRDVVDARGPERRIVGESVELIIAQGARGNLPGTRNFRHDPDAPAHPVERSRSRARIRKDQEGAL
jgi:hypothetical protein